VSTKAVAMGQRGVVMPLLLWAQGALLCQCPCNRSRDPPALERLLLLLCQGPNRANEVLAQQSRPLLHLLAKRVYPEFLREELQKPKSLGKK